MTAGDLINASLKTLGILGQGETPAPNDAEDARLRLNDFLDALATQRLTIYNQARSTYSLVNGQQTYSIGTNGTPDFSQVRPLWIDNVGIILPNVTPANEIQIGPPLTQSQWAALVVKELESPLPSGCYYNQTYPNGELSFWPVPNDATVDVALYYPSPGTTAVASLATTLSIPPGWARMLRYNLACELAPEFGAPIPPRVQLVADESLADIKRTNLQPQDLMIDPALTNVYARPWNIYTGSY